MLKMIIINFMIKIMITVYKSRQTKQGLEPVHLTKFDY